MSKGIVALAKDILKKQAIGRKNPQTDEQKDADQVRREIQKELQVLDQLGHPLSREQEMKLVEVRNAYKRAKAIFIKEVEKLAIKERELAVKYMKMELAVVKDIRAQLQK